MCSSQQNKDSLGSLKSGESPRTPKKKKKTDEHHHSHEHSHAHGDGNDHSHAKEDNDCSAHALLRKQHEASDKEIEREGKMLLSKLSGILNKKVKEASSKDQEHRCCTHEEDE